MTRLANSRRRSSLTLLLPAPRVVLTLLALLVAALALGALALLGPGVTRAEAAPAVFLSRIPGAHYTANAAARVELNRAKSRLKLNNIPGALQAAIAALRADSLSGEAWEERASLHLRAGEFRDAYEALDRAAALAPERAVLWTRLAQVAYLHLGYEQEGNQAIQYAMTIDSLYATAWYTAAVYHWTRADLDAADVAIQRARDLELDQSRTLTWYSTSLGIGLSRGRYRATSEALMTHLATAPNDLVGHQFAAHACRGEGNLPCAKTHLGYMLGVAGSQPTWLVELALVLRAEGIRDSALIYFDRAVKADTMDFDAGYNRALERAAQGDSAGAWRELRRIRVLSDGNFLIPLFASRLARASGDSLRASLAFDEARRLNPALGLATSAELGTSPPIPAWASPDLAEGERLVERGEFTLAGDRFMMAAQDPVRRAAGLFWGSRVARMTDAAHGLPVIAAQAAAEASNGDPVIVRTLAEACLAAGDTSRGIQLLQGLRKVSPDDLVAAALLSDALIAAGDRAAARGVWNGVAQESTRSWRIENSRADAFAAVNDAGTAIARQRAAAADYLVAR